MLPKKVLDKANKELVDLHKRCITTYLTQRSVKHRVQKKFFLLYDRYINEDNIRSYFHRPIRLFVYALTVDKLEQISQFIYSKPKRRKKHA
jgi:hypothetical protein